VGFLDRDVPDTISFAKILPSNWRDYFSPQPSGLQGDKYLLAEIPVFLTDQDEAALVTEIEAFEMGTANPLNYGINMQAGTTATRLLYQKSLVVGDSGSPFCMIVKNELVVLATATGGGVGSGRNNSISWYQDDINTMMANLGGGYRLVPVNLSGFRLAPA